MRSAHLGPYAILEYSSLASALNQMTVQRVQTLVVVDSHQRLVGTLTDGDFRRWVCRVPEIDLNVSVREVANTNCVTLRVGEQIDDDRLFANGVSAIPVVNSDSKVIGIAQPSFATLTIGSREIGEGFPTYVVAEIGVNHNGELTQAKALVDRAVESGANAVKFQLRDLPSLYRRTNGTIPSEDLGAEYIQDFLRNFSLSTEETLEAIHYARSVGIDVLCTPWDSASLAVLETLNMDAYKVASADLTNHPFLLEIAATGRPMIVSTGMSTDGEVRTASDLLNSQFATFMMLHAVSSYPTPVDGVNLRFLTRLRKITRRPVGYSGHEVGYLPTLAAVAMGASLVERHITLDRRGAGPDQPASLEPDEFRRMVADLRAIETSLGSDGPRTLSQGEQLNRISLAKSIIASRDLAAGHILAVSDLAMTSPGKGMQPNRIDELVGRRLLAPVQAGDFLSPLHVRVQHDRERLYEFPLPWGLPVRFHDARDLLNSFTPDFVEYHLSYRDMSLMHDLPSEWLPRMPFTVHSPDLFEGDFLIDLASDSPDIRERSIWELNRVCEIARSLARSQGQLEPIRVIASLGGWSLEHPIVDSELDRMYARVHESLQLIETSDVVLLPQTLPPFPWYLGGRRFCNLFVDPSQIVEFAERSELPICLDISHTRLACTHLGISFSKALKMLLPVTNHLHLADAKGVDGEGLQIGHGDVDWWEVADLISELPSTPSFIPEIWQGHVDQGRGFAEALDQLSTFFRKS